MPPALPAKKFQRGSHEVGPFRSSSRWRWHRATTVVRLRWQRRRRNDDRRIDWDGGCAAKHEQQLRCRTRRRHGDGDIRRADFAGRNAAHQRHHSGGPWHCHRDDLYADRKRFCDRAGKQHPVLQGPFSAGTFWVQVTEVTCAGPVAYAVAVNHP